MVNTFVTFAPLGVVLVAMLGVGVSEHSGYINAGLKGMLSFTPRALLTPMLVLVAIVSHTAADAGYVLVIPLGGVIFYAAGRHPLAGIAAAFAGVSGGFSANFIPSGIDPLLQGFTQNAAQIPALQPQKQQGRGEKECELGDDGDDAKALHLAAHIYPEQQVGEHPADDLVAEKRDDEDDDAEGHRRKLDARPAPARG